MCLTHCSLGTCLYLLPFVLREGRQVVLQFFVYEMGIISDFLPRKEAKVGGVYINIHFSRYCCGRILKVDTFFKAQNSYYLTVALLPCYTRIAQKHTAH